MEVLGLIGFAIGVVVVIALIGKGLEMLMFGSEKKKRSGSDIGGVGLYERNGNTEQVPFTGAVSDSGSGDSGSGDSGSTHV